MSGFRQRSITRLVTRLVRRVAAESGTTRLGVRVRTTSQPGRIVVAYPWRDRNRARALGEAVASVIDGLGSTEVSTLVEEAARRVASTERGPGPTTIRPSVPVVAVTGTNGKTTTSRMIAHIAREAGHLVGWSNTDGIYVDGVQVESGDYSGPSGAGRVLAHREVDFAVTETARGGILLKGIGLVSNDVSVVTNVTADHLGHQGIDTVDQLAEVKGVVPRITKKSGWAVLNADDPRVFAMRLTTPARPWVFSRDPDSPALREVLGAHGRATTVIDGWITVLEERRADPLVEVIDVPMTLSGLVALQRRERPGGCLRCSRRRHPAQPRRRRADVVPARRRAQPGADELLHDGRGLRRDGPGPQRGRARGDDRDHARRPRSRASAAPRPGRGRRPSGRPDRAARRDRRP